MKPILFCPQADALSRALAEHLPTEYGELELRRFPDGESYLRVMSEVVDRDVIICQTLHKPDENVLPLLLLADTLRDLGARRIGLIAPYLSYMRQDIRFKPGEGITSRYFARILSSHFDWLATVDPHLHRYHSLDQIYDIPSLVIPAMDVVAPWIQANVATPLIIGPDAESEQWAATAAEAVGCPYLVLEKTRHGDRDVDIQVPSALKHADRTPVLVDDIISSGHTMMVTARKLVAAGLRRPVCIGVHAVLDDRAHSEMLNAPIDRVVSCNSIEHATNAIDLSPLIAQHLITWGRA